MLIIKVLASGRLTLPRSILRKMNLRAGDRLDVRSEGGQIVLIPKKKRRHKGRIIKDPLTGLPVLTAGNNAPVLTQKEVEEILADFP